MKELGNGKNRGSGKGKSRGRGSGKGKNRARTGAVARARTGARTTEQRTAVYAAFIRSEAWGCLSQFYFSCAETAD